MTQTRHLTFFCNFLFQVSFELRSRLEEKMESTGITLDKMTELMARAGVELAIQLFGGGHRHDGNKVIRSS